MSALEVLSRINKKLDEGWKMSDQSCPVCHTIIMGNPATREFYCVKCQMPAKIFNDDEEYEVEVISNNGNGNSAGNNKKDSVDSFDREEEEENMIFKREAERRKSDEMSKKMGEYLLQGWAMLEDVCLDCLFPLMRSKKGEVVCVGCGPVKKEEEKKPIKQIQYVKPENAKVEERKIDRSKDLDIKMTKEEPKKEILPTREAEKPAATLPEKKETHLQKELPVANRTIIKFDGDMFSAGKFEDSIDFYSNLTQLLKKEANQLAQKGLISNLNAVKDLISVQTMIDNAKKDIFDFTNRKD